MEPYRLLFKSSVEKDLRRIPGKSRTRCVERISRLAADPRPAGAKQLVGADRTYRLRVGAYRVVYQVDDDLRTVTVAYVRHRRDAYR